MSLVVTRDILVWKEKRSDSTSLQHLKSRIELLFGVRIHLPVSSPSPPTTKRGVVSRGGGCEGDSCEESGLVGGRSANEWIKVSGSEEQCYKTQQYVLATFRPDCSTLVPCGIQFANLLFNGSSRLRDAIEKDHQTILLPAPNGILVQGSHSSVRTTVSKLHQLMDTLHYSQVPGYHNVMNPDGNTTSGPSSTQRPQSQPDPTSSSSQELNKQLKQLIKDPHADISDSLKQALLEKLQTPTTTDLYHSTSQHPSPSGPSQYRQGPSQYSQRVKQFVDLGYPQDKVEMVVGSLGTEASDNDIMARLVSIHSSSTTSSRSAPSNSHQALPGSNSGNTGSRPDPSPSVPSSAMLPTVQREGLRPVVIDGSNIAMSHGKGNIFSCRGIMIAVNWFRKRGHNEIAVFVPSWRKEPSKPETPISEQEILFELTKANFIHYTPSRRVRDKKIVCYDDRFIVKLAAEKGGVIVSNDHFRDLLSENNPLWTDAIENRLLMYTFVDDSFMIPSDPLGKHGPHLDDFLRFESGKSHPGGSNFEGGVPPENSIPRDKQPCPYKERCNFGPRCRYYHPERDNKTPPEDTAHSPQHHLHEGVKKDELTMHANSPTKHLPFIDGTTRSERPLVHYGTLEHREAFSPTYPHPLPHLPSESQWTRITTGPPNNMLPRGSTEVSYAPPTSKPLPPQYRQPRFVRPEYFQVASHPPSTGQYYSPDHYIDHTHRLHHHGIETAPLPRRVQQPSHPSRPHSAQHVTAGGYSYYEAPPTHHPQYDHTHSVFDHALQLFPNQRDKIQKLLFQYPTIDLNTLVQYMNR